MNRHYLCMTMLAGCILLAVTFTKADSNSIVAYESSTLWGYAYDVKVSGDYAFYPKVYGLEVIDISDPVNRTIAVRFLMDECQALDISGSFAYMARRDGGLCIVDISNPSAPFLVSTLEIEGRAANITVADDIAFISLADDGVYLVNIANPAAPYQLSRFGTVSDPRKVAVSGHYAYIAQNDYGLQVIDFLIPTSPSLVGSFEGVGSPGGTDYRDIIIYGSYAFIADYAYNVSFDTGGFQVLSVANPTNPELVYIHDLHLLYNLALDGTTLYVSTQTTGVYSFDVSSPAAPVLLDHNDESEFVSEMAIYNDYLITCSRNCEIYDISTPSAMSIVSFNPMMSTVATVFVADNFAYIGHRYSGLTIVDVNDPANPQVVSNYATAGRAYTAQVYDHLAYVTSSAGMEILDVSDPANPTLLGFFEDSDTCSCEEFQIVGNLAYIAGFQSEVYIVDISDPANPIHLSSFSPEYTEGELHLESFDIIGNYGYIPDWGQDVVHIIDVSDPTAPIKVGEYSELGNPMKANFIGNYAYLCSMSSGSDILDVSDPVNPVKIGHIDSNSQREPGRIGDFIIFQDWGSGIDIYNIAEVTNPEYIGEFDTPGSAWDVMPYENYVYIADDDAFLIMSMNLPTYKSGDANDDGTINVGDAVYLINFIFNDGPAPEPQISGDANCDGDVNVGDAVYLINHVFNDGPAPCYDAK